MGMKKDNGVEYLECGGCGLAFDPENEFEMAQAETHDCDDVDEDWDDEEQDLTNTRKGADPVDNSVDNSLRT